MVRDRARVLCRFSYRLGIHRVFLGERGTRAVVKTANVSIIYEFRIPNLQSFS